MIVWLNGAFGAGKTTVAAALRPALPGAVAFNPEVIGWVLRRAVRVPSGDYQDLRSWRRLVVGTAAALDRLAPGPVVVAMSLLRERSTSEIIGALRARGREVRHVPARRDRRRAAPPHRDAAARGAAEEGTRAWRQAHVAEYERERPRLAACVDVVVDTTGRAPDQVASALLAQLSG